MAKARLLAAEFMLSYEFSLLQEDSALAFLYTVPHWDRDGLLTGDAVWGLPMLMSGRRNLQERVPLFVQNWADLKIVTPYMVGDLRILHWTKFRVYNSNIITTREAPSKLPPPPGWKRTNVGLVPEDENELYNLLTQIDPRSSYRAALESELTLRTGDSYVDSKEACHEESMIDHDLSRATRADHHNHNQFGGGGDQSISPPLVIGKGGEGGVENLGELSHAQLVKVALTTGDMLGLVSDWSGYLDFLVASGDDVLIRLIEWIQFQSDQPAETMEKIHSMAALLRSKLNTGQRAQLRAYQRKQMLQTACLICEAKEPTP